MNRRRFTPTERDEILKVIDRFFELKGFPTCALFGFTSLQDTWLSFWDQDSIYWPGLDYEWQMPAEEQHERLMMYAMFLELNGRIP